jgi:hypothetical protein
LVVELEVARDEERVDRLPHDLGMRDLAREELAQGEGPYAQKLDHLTLGLLERELVDGGVASETKRRRTQPLERARHELGAAEDTGAGHDEGQRLDGGELGPPIVVEQVAAGVERVVRRGGATSA